ncbi:uncharacterized protein LOC117114491 [Anneissia japonica]|uniref:uncharacterized protein LOC117114491 n=1 Tax=Anneissia japonica TaxID=1529436 RepID=UPI0014256471|nr:uncharacterized protein LOC117114491 [Anneissia japonica]
MTIYNICNPGVRYPYQLDTKEKTPFGFQSFLMKQQENGIRPSNSTKYRAVQETKWKKLMCIYFQCTTVDPYDRPIAACVVSELEKDESVQLHEDKKSSKCT